MTTGETTASDVLGDMAANASEGFRRAADDAKRAAERAAPVIRQSVAKSVYMLAYGLAFGTVYAAELALELMPEDGVVRKGFRDGAAAAREARAEHRT
ncbi:MAG TPA: hypothetical protein VII75_12520 [Thermoanaerobaculia bacterium]